MSNQIIVGEREIGKTYYLFDEVNRLISNNEQVYVLDSATEHVDKSLLHKVVNKYHSAAVLEVKNQEKIVLHKIGYDSFKKEYKNFFPFTDIVDNIGKIICFDLSYFLEMGYDEFDRTNNQEVYNYYRSLYNYLAEQIAYSLILSQREGIIRNSHVIMDEIEFPKTDYSISDHQGDISFLAAVHPENAFGTFYESFEPIKYKKYVKGE